MEPLLDGVQSSAGLLLKERLMSINMYFLQLHSIFSGHTKQSQEYSYQKIRLLSPRLHETTES